VEQVGRLRERLYRLHRVYFHRRGHVYRSVPGICMWLYIVLLVVMMPALLHDEPQPAVLAHLRSVRVHLVELDELHGMPERTATYRNTSPPYI